jgi:hypothetical protein
MSGFPPPLRLFDAELRRDRAEAQSAKAGSRTVICRDLRVLRVFVVINFGRTVIRAATAGR